MNLRAWLHALRLYAQVSREVSGASAHAFIDRCFWRIWRQGADHEWFGRFAEQLASGQLSRFGLVYQMTQMPRHVEVVRSWRHYEMPEALHMARCQMVRQLPAASTIVDIGGAAPSSLHGALLVMGYRHRFERLYIVDLPPQLRLGTYSQGSREDVDGWITSELGPIRYLHGSMTDLSAVEDQSVDLLFSGQSIEHVSVDDCARVLQEARRVLRPGGRVFFDTPNGALTRIQLPDAFIHPEHQVEYQVDEFLERLRSSGFVVEQLGGIAPMPETLRSRHFDQQELIRNAHLSPDARSCYLFYVQARVGV